MLDCRILDHFEEMETSKQNDAQYIRQAFGNAYRLSNRNWRTPRSETLKDDAFVPYDRSQEFAEVTGVKFTSLKRGGRVSTDSITREFGPNQEVLILLAVGFADLLPPGARNG